MRAAKDLNTAIIIAFAVLGTLCPSAQAFDDAALARRAYDKIILPGYANFDEAARQLAKATDKLCSNPSQAGLAETRNAAREALLAWGRIEPIRFGPITQKQRTERLLFYPDPHAIAGKQTAKLLAAHNDADIDAEKLAGASVAVQGFGALDFALYGHGSDGLTTSTPDGAFRCRYVRALTSDIAQIAHEAHAEWKGEYSEVWLHPGPGNKSYLTAKETTQALYRAYVTQLEVMRTQRLSLLGGTIAKPAGPLLPNSRFALPFVLAGVEGSRDLLGDDGFTAADATATDKENDAVAMLGSVATDLGFALRAGQAAEALAPDPFTDPQARERLTPMVLSLKNAESVGSSALGGLTGLSLGFNSLDGD